MTKLKRASQRRLISAFAAQQVTHCAAIVLYIFLINMWCLHFPTPTWLPCFQKKVPLNSHLKGKMCIFRGGWVRAKYDRLPKVFPRSAPWPCHFPNSTALRASQPPASESSCNLVAPILCHLRQGPSRWSVSAPLILTSLTPVTENNSWEKQHKECPMLAEPLWMTLCQNIFLNLHVARILPCFSWDWQENTLHDQFRTWTRNRRGEIRLRLLLTPVLWLTFQLMLSEAWSKY